MRRHADDIPTTGRGLLTAYWALSGYGLRASRALAWLGTAMLLTIVLLMAFGLAQDIAFTSLACTLICYRRPAK
ncbi:hypothetical protein [Streptomyces massasporeus]|uniref:hypothetical protein n=1 Tax=Streptomyces massasporeus TaxID=67324 RepID=UPI003F4CC061